MIPEAAAEAAAPWIENFLERRGMTLRGKEAHSLAGYVIEAALPYLISHEREQTRLAHLDAVVNAEGLSKYEDAIQHLRDLADNAERDRDYVKTVDSAAIHAAIDGALED